jgi:hypothetical protein
MARRGRAKAAEELTPTPVKISLEYNGEPLYANYAEVSSAQHEFQIGFALFPIKPTAEQIEQVSGGIVKLDALVQILLPPTLIPGLIRALTTTKEQYEAMIGPIKEFGA